MKNKNFIRITALLTLIISLLTLTACIDSVPPDTVPDGYIGISQKNYSDLLSLQGDEKVCLTSDIDLEGCVWLSEVVFNGVFDGHGYTIKNLDVQGKIDSIDATSHGSGLFYKLGGNATVKNVAFVNASVGARGQNSAVVACSASKSENAGEYNKIENVFIQVNIGGNAWCAGVVERGNYIEMTDVVVVAESSARDYLSRQGIVAGLTTKGVKMNNCYFISNTIIGRIQNDYGNYATPGYDIASTYELFNPDEYRDAEQIFYIEKNRGNVILTERLETWVTLHVTAVGF